MSGDCGFITGPDVSGLINAQLSETMGMGISAYSTAMNAMEQMNNVFQSVIQGVGASSGTPTQGASVDITFIKPSPKPVAPEQIVLPTAPVLDFGDLKDLDDVLGDLMAELTTLLGEMPDPPVVLVQDRFLELLGSYYSQLSSQLLGVLNASPIVAAALARLGEWLQPGAIGMSADVEQALRDRGATEIERQSQQAQADAQSAWLARGFTLPSGALVAQVERIQQDAADKKGALNRDVLIEAAKWERDTRQFAIEKGIAYDAMTRDSFFKTYEESRQIAATWQDNHIKVQMAAVDIYKAEVEALGQAANALSAMGNTVATAIKAKLDALRMRLDEWESSLRGITAQAAHSVQLFDGQIRLYGADIQSESARVETLAKNDERLLGRERLKADVTMKDKELAQVKLLESAKITVSALDGVARVASQLAAGVFSSLSMRAGMDVGTNFGNNSSCTTTYSY